MRDMGSLASYVVISPVPECVIRMDASWFPDLWNKSFLVERPLKPPFMCHSCPLEPR